MKKSILALLLFLISNYVAYSQTNNAGCLKGDLGYVSMTFGPSIPVGNFGNKDLNNVSSGYANVGSKVELNAGIKLTPVIGLNLKSFYSINGYDASGLINELSVLNPGTNWQTTGRNWEIYGAMAGLSYSYPFTGKFMADVKALAGIMQTSAPGMTLSSNTGMTITDNNVSATSIAYVFSVGGAYPLGRLIDLTGSMEYLNSKPSFISNSVFSSSIPGSNSVGQATNTNVRQDVSLLTFNLGVRVKF